MFLYVRSQTNGQGHSGVFLYVASAKLDEAWCGLVSLSIRDMLAYFFIESANNLNVGVLIVWRC